MGCRWKTTTEKVSQHNWTKHAAQLGWLNSNNATKFKAVNATQAVDAALANSSLVCDTLWDVVNKTNASYQAAQAALAAAEKTANASARSVPLPFLS